MNENTSAKIQQPASHGWICPKCGAGIAPWVQKCPCVSVAPAVIWGGWFNSPQMPTWTVTCGSTSSEG